MRRGLILTAFLFAFAGVASVAHAEVVQYMSRHPLPKRVGHGFCEIDVPHFHDYPPSDPRLYRQVNGQYYFVGDPTPFGYEGPRYSFYGPHPVVDASVQLGGPTYCYIKGPHYHWYAPAADAHFEMKGGAYWYVGAFDPVFYADQPRFVVVNDVYAPLVYERPIIDVSLAPPAFHGEIIVGRPGYYEGVGWRGPGPGPGWRGPDHREMVMHERHEEWRARSRGGNDLDLEPGDIFGPNGDLRVDRSPVPTGLLGLGEVEADGIGVGAGGRDVKVEFARREVGHGVSKPVEVDPGALGAEILGHD